MKRINIFKYSILATVLVLVTIMACEKQLDKTNPSYPSLDTYFRTAVELQNGVNSVYSIFRAGQLVGREWFFLHDLRSDDVLAGGGQLEVPRAQILNGDVSPDNSVMNDVWKGLYTAIHRANTVTFFADRVTDNAALRDKTVGEAKFFRGWAYFELVSLWGPVPMYLEPVSSSSQFQPRASEEAVYNQIVRDLKDAAAVLPQTYADADRGRVTWGAAKTMLGRVYMQRGNYDSARLVLSEVRASNLYTVNIPYENNFKEETEFNAESIMEAVYFENIQNTFNWGGQGDDPSQSMGTTRNQEYSPIAWRNLIPSNRFLEAFERTERGAAKTDPRLKGSVYRTGDLYNNDASVLTDKEQNGNGSRVFGDSMKVSWRKYTLIYKHGVQDRAGGGINMRILRYAEVLLMLAECAAEQNDLGAAVGYLNEVRNRPGVQMPNYPTAQYPTGSKADVMRAVMHEKTVEMGAEQVRNRDILRWRKKGYFTTEPISYFRPGRDERLPIPQQEIDNNPELGAAGIPKQNAGY